MNAPQTVYQDAFSETQATAIPFTDTTNTFGDMPPARYSTWGNFVDRPMVSVPQSTVHDSVSLPDLESYIEAYIQDCELRLQSPRTVETRQLFLRNLLWFLKHRGYEKCGAIEIRQFSHYLMHGHDEPGGRFGNKNLTRPVRPVTVMDYYTVIRHLFDWLVAQRILQQTPFYFIPKPIVHTEIKSPLSTDHIGELLKAAGKSADPIRNVAILLFLLDTGCRASELVSMRRRDLDLANGRCKVRGKGNKDRTLFFGQDTAAALSQLVQRRGDLGPDEPLFPPARGTGLFTRSGLLHLIKRLGAQAGIKDAVSVHALRRTFAVQMLRNGANAFSVQAILGHTTLQQTRKYCAMALTDAEAQHRQFSPVDRL